MPHIKEMHFKCWFEEEYSLLSFFIVILKVSVREQLSFSLAFWGCLDRGSCFQEGKLWSKFDSTEIFVAY